MTIEAVEMSPLRRKQVRGWFANDPELDEAIDDVQRAEAEHNEAITPVRRRIERIERLKESFQKTGMNREIAMRAIEETENPQLLDEGGLAIESFTTIPSKVNLLAMEELTDKQKNVAIGAAAVVGIGLVLKLIQIIWKFFRNMMSKGKGDDKESKDPAIKARAKAVEIQNQEKAIEVLQDTLSRSNAIRDELQKLEQALLKEDAYLDRRADITDAWNELLEDVFNNGEISRAAVSTFAEIRRLESGLEESKIVATHISEGILTKGKTEDGLSWFTSETGPIYNKLPPADMVKNLEKLQGYLTKAQEKRDKVVPLSENQIEKIAKILEQSNGIKFIDNLVEYSPYSKNALFLRDNDFDNEATKILDELKAKAEAADLNPNVAPKLKEFITFFGNGAKAYFALIRFYMLVSNSYLLFLSKYEKFRSWNAKKIFKYIVEVAKESGIKIAASADEYLKKNTHNIKDLFSGSNAAMSDDEFAKSIDDWIKANQAKARKIGTDLAVSN